jgi:TonB-dependent starch-binding outer membrane protein SusC
MTKLYLSLSRYLTALLILVTSVAWSQSRTVTGKVTSADDGSGLPGVNVVEKGTNNGTVTDVDGNYSLNVGDNSTLVFSFVGFASQEVVVGGQTSIAVSLAADVRSLDEVVVVGYGTQEKKEITSAVASVKAEDFNRGTVNDPAQLLQGKVAGLNISRPGGDPNGGFTIRLRGVSTFGANAEPLVVIDGVIGGSLSTVDPNDIASIDVLKDGSAAAIYGTRGSSGVILITTKSGKAGRTTVEYNGSVAMETVGRRLDFMSADEYRQVPGATDLGADTDWLDVVTRTGFTHVHNLSLGGGSQGTTYRASFNLREANGIGLNTGFTQINGRFNLSQKALNDKLTVSLNLSTTSRQSDYGDAAAFRYAVIANPTMPVYDNTLPSEGLSQNPGGHLGGYAEFDAFDVFNPLSIAEQNINQGRDNRLLASIRGEYELVKNFRAAFFYSRQWETDLRGYYSPKTAKFGGGVGAQGLARTQNFNRYNDLYETTLNYDKNFGDLNLALLAGYSYQNFFNQGSSIQVRNFINDAFTYNSIGYSLALSEGLNSDDLGQTYSYADRNELQAFFGRANLNFKDTYFFSASARYEGSSRFGSGNKYGLFPAASAGVTISNLVDLPSINTLKARVSYGVTGAQPNESYASIQRLGRTGNFYYNGKFIPTYGPISNSNPNLSWETKSEINFGLDATLLDGRLSGTLDYYTRDVSDLILRVNVPVTQYQFPTMLANVGDLTSRGFEAALNYVAVDNTDLRWTTGINFATNKTIVESLSSGEFVFGSEGVAYQAGVGSPGQNDYRISRVKEGEELGQFFSWVQTGIDEASGEPLFEDLNGDGDDDDEEDKRVIGQALPNATVGWTNTVVWKNFDLNFFFRGVFGHDIMNSYRTFYENTGAASSYNVLKTEYYDPTLKVAKYNNTHIEKGDFVKLDNITLGYTPSLPSGGAVSRLRVYISAQNPFVITGYTGIDPEVRYGDVEDGNNALSPGIERRSTYFTTRTFTFGVNVGF